MPPSFSTNLTLELPLEVAAIAGVVYEVDVERVHRAVPGRIDDEGTACTAAARMGCIHPLIVVAHVAGVDALQTSTAAPHLVPTLVPTASAAEEHMRLQGILGNITF